VQGCHGRHEHILTIKTIFARRELTVDEWEVTITDNSCLF
jgi:hypothetical protein